MIMLKYVLAVACFCLFFLVPLKNLKESNEFLIDERFMLEMEVDKKNKNIDSLNVQITELNKKIDSLKIKPLIKKRYIPKSDTLTVKKINIVDEIILTDTNKINN